MFEDELKEANEHNTILSALLQELEAKLAEESQQKDGKLLLPWKLNHIRVYSRLIMTLSR
jgi:hypothetical protein